MDGDHGFGGEAGTNEASARTNAQKDAKPPVHTGVLMRFPRALKALAVCSRVGTEKRGIPLSDVGFWSDPLAYDRYREARARHILEEAIEGLINLDPRDQGLAHDVQCAWDALAVVECRLWREEQAKRTSPFEDDYARYQQEAARRTQRAYGEYT